jgi:hypothetical protein
MGESAGAHQPAHDGGRVQENQESNGQVCTGSLLCMWVM